MADTQELSAAAAIPDHVIALLAVADKLRELQETAATLAEQVEVIRTSVYVEPVRMPDGYHAAILKRVEQFDLAGFCQQAEAAYFARYDAARASAA